MKWRNETPQRTMRRYQHHGGMSNLAKLFWLGLAITFIYLVLQAQAS